MNRKEFQTLAVRTNSQIEDIELTAKDHTLFTESLNALIAITEILDVYKKHIFYGRAIVYKDLQEHIRETRDVMIHLADMVTEPSSEHDVPISLDTNIFHAILGTITEHGELAIALQYALAVGEFDLVNVCEELGDSDWYKALFYETTGINWEDVQGMIIKKLEIRFTDQIFTQGGANERDLEAERKLLEESILASVEEYKASRG